MDNIIQRIGVPKLAVLVAGLLVGMIVLANLVGGGSGLADYAIGTWTCRGVQSGEPSAVDEQRLDALPEPFDGLSEGVNRVTTFPYAEEEDQMLYEPGSAYSIGNGSVTVLEDGTFHTVGLLSSDAQFGTWAIEDGVPVVRFTTPDDDLNSYAATAEVGEDEAVLVSWDGSSAQLFDARVTWSDVTVSVTLNSHNAIYQADCVKADNTGTPLDY